MIQFAGLAFRVALAVALVGVAQPGVAQESDLERLARDIAYQQRRIPAAERSPAIQMIESRLDRELLQRYRRMNATQQVELQIRVVSLLSEPGLMKLVDGVLVAEDFDAPYIDLHQWQIMSQDDSIQVTTTDGVLAIRGKVSGGVTLGPGFAGIVSETQDERDVELVARVNMGSELPARDGDCLAIVHLCGTQPDWFTHVEFGKRRDGGPTGWAVIRRHLRAAPYITPFDTPIVIGAWSTVKIRHEAKEDRTFAWIDAGSGWRKVLDGEPCSMTTTKVELKTLVTAPGAQVDVAFDDCRLYLTPESTPLRVLVLDVPGEGTPQPGVRVVARVAESNVAPAAAVTDQEGRCSLTLPSDVEYPARVRFEGWMNGKKIFQQPTPEVVGVRGVYPGDTWMMVIGTNPGEVR
jgi:hypothetical protein